MKEASRASAIGESAGAMRSATAGAPMPTSNSVHGIEGAPSAAARPRASCVPSTITGRLTTSTPNSFANSTCAASFAATTGPA